MKRPPGLWLLLSAGVLWLCFQDVSCVRATKLIFGKSTTSTTTTTTTVAPEEAAEEEGVTEAIEVKSNLTGVPQMDYIYDPNLPRELNGANLTEYPFYDRVPEEIDFKCDGLHDGFYASIAHKCQVYHHCLYGTRYDFLCANYTAFDQKTFICQFVSEVDCVNSKNFWHRNDALYKATTTTTVKPTFVYTPPEPPSVLSGGRRPGAPAVAPNRRRKPARRRRPQYDYYDEYEEDDDYYEEPRYTATEATRASGRRKRPRPRPRPVYDDEYEEYEDERYERRRNTGRRGEEERRTYDRRGRPPGRRNNKDERRKQEEDYDEEDDDPRFDKSEAKKRPGGLNKRREDDDVDERPKKRREEEVVEERSKKRREEEVGDERSKKRREENAQDDKPNKRREEDVDDARLYKKRRQEDVPEERPKSRKNQQRPVLEEYDEVQDRRPGKKGASSNDDEDFFEERKERRPLKAEDDTGTKLVKPLGTSIYDRPRAAPKVRPPVPKTEADKYSYKTMKSTAKPLDEEYYDDYEDEVKSVKSDSTPASSIESKKTRKDNTYRVSQKNSRPRPGSRKPARDDYDEDYEDERPRRPIKDRRVESRKKPVYDEYEDVSEETKSVPPSTTSKILLKDRKYYREDKPRSTTSTTTEAPVKEELSKMSVRVVKRPFLPSRGGNPYSPRGLQPLGLQANEESRKEDVNTSLPEAPTPRKQNKYIPIKEDYPRNNKEQAIPIKTIKNVETNTPKSKQYEKTPLDLLENEYDVTLNDALNPTLPNLPLRSYPTGFSVSNDYTYSAFQRPRYVDSSLNQASSDYSYRFKIPQSQIVPNQQGPRGPQVFEHQSIRNPSQNYQNFRASPRVPQTYYTTF